MFCGKFVVRWIYKSLLIFLLISVSNILLIVYKLHKSGNTINQIRAGITNDIDSFSLPGSSKTVNLSYDFNGRSEWNHRFLPGIHHNLSHQERFSLYKLLTDEKFASACRSTLVLSLSLDLFKHEHGTPALNDDRILYDYPWHMLMHSPPISYYIRTKNPCFFIKATATVKCRRDRSSTIYYGISEKCPLFCPKLQCLPAYFIAGWPKAASTDLWTVLSTHQQVRT